MTGWKKSPILTKDEPDELARHYQGKTWPIEHIRNLTGPQLKQMIDSGEIDPQRDIVKRLDGSYMLVKDFISNPAADRPPNIVIENSLRPSIITDYLMSQGHYIALDGLDLCKYDGRIYRPVPDTKIKGEMKRIWGDVLRIQGINEALLDLKSRVYIDRERLEIEPHLIAVNNGLLNINTRELTPHTPARPVISIIPIDYLPEATAPHFKQYLNEVCHPENVQMMAEIMGWCLIRNYKFQRFFIFVGAGHNGKSVFINVLSAMLGDENISHMSLQTIANDKFAPARLYGKYANLCADISSEALKHTGIIKILTGEDKVFAQQKYKDGFEFRSYAKLLFSANEPPRIYDDTDAMFRRLTTIHFPFQFIGNDDDKDLEGKLLAELPGIFNLALDGRDRLIKQGDFTNAPTIEQNRETYQARSSTLIRYISECIEETGDEADYISKEELNDDYRAYCHALGIVPEVKANITKQLPDLIATKEAKRGPRRGQVRAWAGIQYKDGIPGIQRIRNNLYSNAHTHKEKVIQNTLDTADTGGEQ